MQIKIPSKIFQSMMYSVLLITMAGCSQQYASVEKAAVVQPAQEKFKVIFGGTDVGGMTVNRDGQNIDIDFSFSNNGRGASSQEVLQLSDKGLPIDWQISGKTVFGNEVNEQFSLKGNRVNWQSSSESGSAEFNPDALFIAQNASPYALYIYAKALLGQPTLSLSALPAGELTISQVSKVVLTDANNAKVNATIYAVKGINLDPSYIALDDNQLMLGYLSPRVVIIREGLEAQSKVLSDLAANLNASRFEIIAQKAIHQYDKPIRINNVRIFDPVSLQLTAAKSVLLENDKIKAIEAMVDSAKEGEVLIEGNGGTLIPGLYEMHGHMSDNDALLNVLAGVTSVRDMGNEIDILDPLIDKIETNQIIGPRITKSGFIEGKSEFSAATGEIASTEQEAVDLVNMYGEKGGYFQIKVYSSINGEWVPAMAKAAKKHGMRITGHIPAFSNADEMIAAGYDEITHINQAMLSWVLDKDEDTRTLYRITGMKRFVDLDLNSDKVQHTLNTMVAKNIAVDPTIVIHELGLTARNGETRIGVKDYIDHMPIGEQRSAKVALLNVADEQEDKDYRLAFDKVIETLALMHKKGILLVPGTDLGGAFELHRELELFKKIGMTNAEVLRRASYDMANYLGYGEQLGSIEVGKYADFFLVPGDPIADLRAIKTVAMVSKGGVIYFPSEVYPEFGIKPFTAIPTVVE
ncbi:amidohydrolase family protein [Shewanella glacialimarina]|uniref:amidohydrolase family protein n=1 Tax=Shewanella glacialimarina TaxID=2590884 RepID=UPI001CF7EF74|nr:amidohydrolase family protein [Shewanella glacialimarina]UCX04281.1 amidohydrolase family protein [Shewanella glacialimarina]